MSFKDVPTKITDRFCNRLHLVVEGKKIEHT